MGWNIHGTRVPVATMSMESKERCGNFSHIQKDIIRTKRDAIVLRPRFFLPKRCRSDSNLATGAEGFSPGVKNISVLSATMPSLRKSLSICNQRNTINYLINYESFPSRLTTVAFETRFYPGETVCKKGASRTCEEFKSN